MIEVCGLTKRYGTAVAVEDLTFTAQPGRVTGFLGPNGSGKSTTMRAVLGLDRPDAGSTRVAGTPYTELPRPVHQVGALLDPHAVHAGRPARDHLAALAASNHIPRSRVAAVLEQVGLAGVAHQRVGGFSLGMKQRLGIACALLGDPAILLFDEPTNGLDPDGVLWMRTLLTSLAREGRTVFVSSHLMSEMAMTADHLVVIGRGKLIADLPTDEFLAQHSTGEVLARTPHARELADLLRSRGATAQATGSDTLTASGIDAATTGELACRAGLPLHHLSTRQVSLEEAYLALTTDTTDFRTSPAAPMTAAAASKEN
jgi:ABC-2 type transport system ATP-binding protein